MVPSQAMTALRLSAGTISDSSGNFAPAVTQTARRPWRTVSAEYQKKEPSIGGTPQNLRKIRGIPMARLTSATRTRPCFLQARAAASPKWPPKRMPSAHATCPKDPIRPAWKSLMPIIWKYIVENVPALMAMQPKRPCRMSMSKVGLRKKLARCLASESNLHCPRSDFRGGAISGTSMAATAAVPTSVPNRPTRPKTTRQPCRPRMIVLDSGVADIVETSMPSWDVSWMRP
mmetsp:Transcript_102150/g.324566  ORF Transcript_102150/g.324566 Transcript_102150/m.324566 type:complete len:231 (+) Transcript_102150:329-1021(+)